MNTIPVFFLLFYAPWTAEANINIEGFEGGEIMFQCAHRFAQKNPKYFCNNTCKSKADVLVTVKYGETAQSGRIMLVDLKNGSFTVNFSQLNVSDSGRYWCAVDRPGLDTFTAVNLSVNKEKDLKTYSITVSNTAAKETPPVPPDVSPTWTYQDIFNTTQLIFEMDTSGPTNVSTTSNCTGRGEANFSTTSFRKCTKISQPQPQLRSNSSDLVNADERQQVNRTFNDTGEEMNVTEKSPWRTFYAQHRKLNTPASESAAAEAVPCPVYENISRNAHWRHLAANVQNDHDITRIYIKPLPPVVFEGTDKHASNFAGNGQGGNRATSGSDTRFASGCDSTDSGGRSLWFGLDISGTI